MPTLVCRTAWMPFYQDVGEPAYSRDGWIAGGNMPYEALNFLSVDGVYYGYVAVPNARNIDINRLGAQDNDDQIGDILVVFCAPHPVTDDLLVVGWYNRATVFRHWIDRPDRQDLGLVRFTSENTTLVEKSQRGFSIPRGQGGMGAAGIWYGLNCENAEQLAENLLQYIDQVEAGENPEPPAQTMLESKRRSKSLALERRGSVRGFIRIMGFTCEACGQGINEEEQQIWGSSFELHHLTPFENLNLNETHEVCENDFAVLCATCHRAIRRWGSQGGDISDVARFSHDHLEQCRTLCRRKPRTPE